MQQVPRIYVLNVSAIGGLDGTRMPCQFSMPMQHHARAPARAASDSTSMLHLKLTDPLRQASIRIVARRAGVVSSKISNFKRCI
jgi:hypothetical protein